MKVEFLPIKKYKDVKYFNHFEIYYNDKGKPVGVNMSAIGTITKQCAKKWLKEILKELDK